MEEVDRQNHIWTTYQYFESGILIINLTHVNMMIIFLNPVSYFRVPLIFLQYGTLWGRWAPDGE